MRTLAAGLVAVIAVALGVYVAVGMIEGADPCFTKGCSSTQAVVGQEVAGAFALAALIGVVVGCFNFARGKRVGWLLIPLPVAFVLIALWLLAYLSERAS
jgi:hypothetical protein